MNLIKGMDRIALAICFFIVGFIGGADDASEKYRIINPEYERWAANPFLQVDKPPNNGLDKYARGKRPCCTCWPKLQKKKSRQYERFI